MNTRQRRPNQPTRASRTILLVSRDRAVRGLLAAVLETAGYRVRMAEAARPPRRAGRRPSLVVVNGFTPASACLPHTLRPWCGETEEIPVLVLSMNDAEPHQAVELGTTYYQPWPFRRRALLAVVDRLTGVVHHDDVRQEGATRLPGDSRVARGLAS